MYIVKINYLSLTPFCSRSCVFRALLLKWVCRAGCTEGRMKEGRFSVVFCMMAEQWWPKLCENSLTLAPDCVPQRQLLLYGGWESVRLRSWKCLSLLKGECDCSCWKKSNWNMYVRLLWPQATLQGQTVLNSLLEDPAVRPGGCSVLGLLLPFLGRHEGQETTSTPFTFKSFPTKEEQHTS